MADTSWVKLSTNFFSDEKIRVIRTLDNGETVTLVFLNLIAIAGRLNDDGRIYIKDNLNYSTSSLSAVLGLSLDVSEYSIRILNDFELIDVEDNGLIYINNWEKHQNVDGLEKIKRDNRERQRRFREKQRSNVTRNSDVTPSNATEVDKEVEVDNNNNNNNVISLYNECFGKANKVVLKELDKLINTFGKEVTHRAVEKTAKYVNDPRGAINYLEATLIDWSENGENKKEKEEKPTQKRKRKQTNRKKETTPDWYGKKIEETPVTEELKQEFKEKINKLRESNNDEQK